MVNLQQITFDKLKAVIERSTRPKEETDGDLIKQLNQDTQILNDAQVSQITDAAIRQYAEAITRNVTAMQNERQRMLLQVGGLNMQTNAVTGGAYNQPTRDEQLEVLKRMVLQKVRLDESTADLKARTG